MAEELQQLILEKTSWDEQKLESEVIVQQERFAGLLTREGALEIIARETGVKPLEEQGPAFVDLSACRNRQGKAVNVRARVWHVFAPKKFVKKTEKGERVGKVCNLLIRDAGGEAALVLWGGDVALVEKGEVERNDVLEVKGAFVKSTNPLELHSSLLTKISVADGEFPELPRNEKPALEISALTQGTADADFYGRVLRIGQAQEFVRIAKSGLQEKGVLCDATLSDGRAAIRCVAWDENARVLERAGAGDAVKIESAYVKKNARSGEAEAQVGWQGRVVLSPKNHSLADAQSIWQSFYAKKLLNELAEGEQALVTAKVIELRGASVVSKCGDCGQKTEAVPCPACGGQRLRSLLVVRTRLDDGFANITCTFFDREALALLGLKKLDVAPDTALELKRDYLLASEVSVVLQARKSEYTGELEATAKHVVSTAPSAVDEANALAQKLGN